MRYFLISYAHSRGFGNTFIGSKQMPDVQKAANESANSSTTVLNVVEFKNEKDWLNAQGR